MRDIQDKVVYITGGTKGIGKGIAKSLLDQGCKVAISGRDIEKVREVAQSLGKPEHVLAIASDVRVYEQESAAVDLIIKTFGKLDVVGYSTL